MDDITRLAELGAAEGVVVVADEQTAGRGRAGRSWHAAPGTALLCSILLRPEVTADRLSLLPLLAGVAVAEAIEQCAPVSCRLKWPNDVWIGEQKVCGALMTARTKAHVVDFVVLGIGVNLTSGFEDLVPGATSIKAESGVEIEPTKMLTVLLAELQRHYDCFRQSPGGFQVSQWTERAALLNEAVEVADRGEVLTGTFVGVDDRGALRLETRDGLRNVVVGDLSRGPTRRA